VSQGPRHPPSTFGRAYPRAGVTLSEFAVVITASALFGIAAETVMSHFGVDIPGAWTALMHANTSLERAAFSWWSLWGAGYTSFLIGRRGVEWARTRRNLEAKFGAALLLFLLLSPVGHLESVPSGLGAGTTLLLRISAPLVMVALATWGLALANRRPWQSWREPLAQTFKLPIASAICLKSTSEVESRRIRVKRKMQEDADLPLGTEVVDQLSHVGFRTLGL